MSRNWLYGESCANYVKNRPALVLAWAKHFDAFGADDVMSAHGMTRQNANKVLSRLVSAGRLVRLSTGVYAVAR